jgi:predicted component of type VI protein secretion system
LIRRAVFRKNNTVMPKITLFVPDAEPMKIAFDDQEVVNVGRAADNDIVLNHDSISGHHAQLKLVDGGYILVDLDSTNGTFFAGAPAANNPLHHGADIAFGQVPAKYEDETEAAAAPEAAAEEPAAAASSGFSDTEISGGESLSHSIHAQAAAQAVRPAGFGSLSPLGNTAKKDAVGQSIMLVGILALLTAIATIASAFIMTAG